MEAAATAEPHATTTPRLGRSGLEQSGGEPESTNEESKATVHWVSLSKFFLAVWTPENARRFSVHPTGQLGQHPRRT